MIVYDLIIKNGLLVDGSGGAAYYSDIAVSDGKIVRISEEIAEDGRAIIDARGLTVTPGFIDSHSHSDDALFTNPEMIEKIEQGITTSIGGQCGLTMAPISLDITEKNASEIPGFGKETEVYKTFGSMIHAAKTIPLGSNLFLFVGHAALRKAVIGFEDRKPTPEEMEKMKALLSEAMENGALGLSFGLIYTPSCYAETDELVALSKVVKKYDGLICAHLRNEGFEFLESVDEFLSVIKTVGIKAVFSHHKSMYRVNWGKVKESLKKLDTARQEGYDIYCDVYPYSASSTGLVPTIIAKELRDVNSDGLVKLVSNQKMRKTIKELYSERYGESLDNLLVVECSGYPEYEGKRLDEISKLRGQDDFDAAFDLIIASGGDVQICNFCMCEEDIERVLRYDRSMIGTDASVGNGVGAHHPRCRGTFPRVLGRYVRERKVTTLPEMIRKCTSLPASVYGISRKGILQEGFDADICIFDADTIVDRADYMDCRRRSEGLSYVVLGGEVVVENGIFNGKKMGAFLPAER